MPIIRLWLVDFRCFSAACLEPDPDGLTVLEGPNGAGKSSVLEAIGFLATQRSFRASARDALVRRGAERAIVRGEARTAGREMLVEAEIAASGAVRAMVNRRPARKRADLAEAMSVSVFAPGDLELVQGAPSVRREFLDDTLIVSHHKTEALVIEVDRILRQRAALLRQSFPRGGDFNATLEVWDERLAAAGTQLAEERESIVGSLAPLVGDAYGQLAADRTRIDLRYVRSWEGDLARAIAQRRDEDLRRQVTTVGPHRDDLDIAIAGRPSRNEASRGEQRCLAFALRLAAHELARASLGQAPVLLLDDVLSELDPRRAEALVGQLPKGQVLLTTAVGPPSVVKAERVVQVSGATLVAGATQRAGTGTI